MRNRAAACFVVALVVTAVVGPEVVLAGTPPESTVPPLVLSGEFATDRVIVGFESGVSAVQRVQTMSTDVAQAHSDLSSAGADAVTTVVELPEGISVEAAIAEYQADPNVAFVEPDYVRTTTVTSNDPLFLDDYLWGMEGDQSSPGYELGSGAAEAWAVGYTGSKAVYVGIIDEGIDVTHPDLAANAWTNLSDPVDGVDNDGNGFIDDVHGWDFYNGDNSVYDGVAEPGVDYHGTHVAGTIGAVGGNGQGVVGVNWNVTMISAKFLHGDVGGFISDEIAALNYLVDLKVNQGINLVAVNASFGGAGYSQAELDAIDNAGDHGILVIAAAGNDASNNDTVPSYPANYQCTNGGTRGWDCIVSVAALSWTGDFADFSNWGLSTVDLAAPGLSITSTVPGGSYETWDGTSMATPHVTGAIALCASINPAQTAAQLREKLLASVATTVSLWNTASHGRLDVGEMTARCEQAPAAPVAGAVSDLSVERINDTDAVLRWTDTLSGETEIEVQWAYAHSVSLGGSNFTFICDPFSNYGSGLRNTTSFTVSGFQHADDYCFRIRGSNLYGGGSYTAWSDPVRATSLWFTRQTLPPVNLLNYGTYWDGALPVAGGPPLQYTSYLYRLVAGALPPGVTLASNGFISTVFNSRSQIGVYTFTIEVTEINSGWTARKTYTLTVLPQLPANFVKGAPTNGAKNRSKKRLTITWGASKRAISYQYCVDTINDNECNTTWISTKKRNAVLRNLAPQTTYYWQVRAVNAGGSVEASRGRWCRFTTGR